MTYVETTIEALRGELGAEDGTDEQLVRMYALLVHVTGRYTSVRDVHDAWALWRCASTPDHPDLVPFGQLSPQVQAYDRPYCDAIRAVAGVITLT